MQCKSCHTCTCTHTVRLSLLRTLISYMYLRSYLATHHIYELNRARTGFMHVNKTRTTFGNPDQIWQPIVVRGRTNFGSEKWSARTTFCPDQFSRDRSPLCQYSNGHKIFIFQNFDSKFYQYGCCSTCRPIQRMCTS